MIGSDVLWAGVGLTAQAVFAMRFVWQWIVSEKRQESVIPVGFWYFSLVGGLMLTIYAIFRDPVLIPGQTAGLAIYVRNLFLIHRKRRAQSAEPQQQSDAPSRRAA